MCLEERQLCAIECCWNIKIPFSVKVPFFSERLPSQDCFLRPGFSTNFPLYPLFSNQLRAEQWIFSQLTIEFCYFPPLFFTAYWNVCFWYHFWKKSISFYFQFCVYVYVHSNYGYRCPWKPEREPDAFQPELQAVGSYLTQVLRTKLRSSVWVVSTPHSGIISSSPISFSKGWIH